MRKVGKEPGKRFEEESARNTLTIKKDTNWNDMSIPASVLPRAIVKMTLYRQVRLKVEAEFNFLAD